MIKKYEHHVALEQQAFHVVLLDVKLRLEMALTRYNKVGTLDLQRYFLSNWGTKIPILIPIKYE
jgi:hypothetical protein